MNIHPDFEDFLKFLNDEAVDYLIVGGYAVAFHGYVRATNDMDLFFRNTEETIGRIVKALERFGIPTTEKDWKRFSAPGNIIRIGVPPVLLEMINNISGVEFDEAWEHRVKGSYGKTPVWYVSLPDLLRNKRLSGRPKDLVDFDELGGNKNN